MEEEKMARAISVDQEERQPGLLSRAFAPGSSFARAVSLHNLLDVQHLDTLPESVRPCLSPLMHFERSPLLLRPCSWGVAPRLLKSLCFSV